MNDSALVLICEDDPLIGAVVADGLQEAGYKAELAKDGADAMAMIEADPDNIRALVTDINLGDGPSGWEVARRGRELISDLPVVYMTAASGPEWTSHGVPNSVLVAKPFVTAQIVTAVSTLLNDLAAHRAT